MENTQIGHEITALGYGWIMLTKHCKQENCYCNPEVWFTCGRLRGHLVSRSALTHVRRKHKQSSNVVTVVTGHFRTVQVVQAATVFPKNIKGRSWWEIDSAYNLEISLANAPKNTIQGSSLGIDPPCKLLTLCFQIRSLQFSLTLTANSQRTRSYSIFAQKLASQAERIPTSTTRNVCALPTKSKPFGPQSGK